jgi:hypothetical protein
MLEGSYPSKFLSFAPYLLILTFCIVILTDRYCWMSLVVGLLLNCYDVVWRVANEWMTHDHDHDHECYTLAPSMHWGHSYIFQSYMHTCHCVVPCKPMCDANILINLINWWAMTFGDAWLAGLQESRASGYSQEVRFFLFWRRSWGRWRRCLITDVSQLSCYSVIFGWGSWDGEVEDTNISQLTVLGVLFLAWVCL